MSTRIKVLPRAGPATGDMLEGVVALPCGESCPVEGVAVRVADDEVLVWFTAGIAYKTILDEQRRLLVTHPGFLGRKRS